MEINGDLSSLTRKQKKKRLELFHNLTYRHRHYYKKFKDFEYELIPNFHGELNDYYWNLFVNRVKPYIRNHGNGEIRANRYKVVSGVELTIMRTLPIFHEDDIYRRELNADLAFTCAKTILQRWGGFTIQIGLKDFNREHLLWLKKLNTYTSNSLFSNSQTLRLYDRCLQIKNHLEYIHDPSEAIKAITSTLKHG